MDVALDTGGLGGSVFVVRFSGDVISLDVLESVIHKTTIATLVTLKKRARDQLLFGKVNRLRSLTSNDQSRF